MANIQASISQLEQLAASSDQLAAARLQKATAANKQACTRLTRMVHPLTKRLPSNEDLKESLFQSVNPRLHRLTWMINHLSCLLLTAPLSAMDISFHAFWCGAKLSLLLLRGTIYTLTGGMFGTFLPEHVSRQQVQHHAKKVAYFSFQHVLWTLHRVGVSHLPHGAANAIQADKLNDRLNDRLNKINSAK